MNLSTTVLGSTACQKLRETAESAVLQIGSDKLTRADLARVGCYNFMAARILTGVLHQELQVKNLRQVYDEVPPGALVLPRLGVVSLAVLGAAFEAKGIGGQMPLESYVKKHLANGARMTTFDTMKHAKEREAAERARERKARKNRKAQRRNQAQEIRVDRFEERQA